MALLGEFCKELESLLAAEPTDKHSAVEQSRRVPAHAGHSSDSDDI
ncbi:hypothetical protein [Haladaptatus sp. DYSN1]|nr:hypothetical protein [Haladaptatus sp. DYSN1]